LNGSNSNMSRTKKTKKKYIRETAIIQLLNERTKNNIYIYIYIYNTNVKSENVK
jgi:hypothetical protein